MPSISPVQDQILENGVKDLCTSACDISQWTPTSTSKYPSDSADFKHFGNLMTQLLNTGDSVMGSGLDSSPLDYHPNDMGYTSASTWQGVHPMEWTSAQVIDWMYEQVFRRDYETVPIYNFRPVTGKNLVQMKKADLLTYLREDYADRVIGELDRLLAQFGYMPTNQCTQNLLPGSVYPSPYDGPSDNYYFSHPLISEEVYQSEFNARSYNPNPCQQYPCEPWCAPPSDVESDGESGHSTFVNSPYVVIPSKISDDAQKPHRRGPGRPPREGKKNKKNGQRSSRLWEFIRDLLKDKETCPRLVKWEDRDEGVFRFVQSDQVAKLWGERKANPRMTYEKLSRAMRYYYKSKVLQPVLGRRLVYKFGPTATGWRPHEMA